MVVHEIESEAQFRSLLESGADKLVVIDFSATWCGPCKMIKPHFKALSDEFPAAVFITVDVDELDGLAGEYGIRAMPTFIFIKNGKKVADLLGADANKLKELVKQHH